MAVKRETFITELEPVSEAINKRYDGKSLERLHLSLALNRLEIETELPEEERVLQTENYSVYYSDYWHNYLERHVKRFVGDEAPHIMGMCYVLHQVVAEEYHDLNADCEHANCNCGYVVIPA